MSVLDDAFRDSPHTVRFGMTEELWSYEEIKAFRRTRNTAGTPRELVKYVITTYGDSFATANVEFQRTGGPDEPASPPEGR